MPLLTLKFVAREPQLDRIVFRWSDTSQPAYWQQGDSENPMSWTRLPQALALIFLDYLSAARAKRVGPVFFYEGNSGGLVSALGNAIGDLDHRLHGLFAERLLGGKPRSRVKQVFHCKNVYGKGEGERRIFIRSDFLPPESIEVYWGISAARRRSASQRK